MHSGIVKFLLCWFAVLYSCAAESGIPASTSAGQATEALELLSASPDDVASLWLRSPIVLRFSAPVDAGSVNTGVRLESSAGPVDFTKSAEGDTVTLAITTPLIAPATITLAIGAELRDQSGRAARATTRSWELPLWHTSAANAASARAPMIASAREHTWLAWEAEADGAAVIRVAEYDATGIGNAETLAVEAGARLADLVLDAQGRPVVAWVGAAAHAARLENETESSAWQLLDAGLDAALLPGRQPRLARGEQDAILIAWPTANSVELASWSGAGPWQRMAAAQQTAIVHDLDLAWSLYGVTLAVRVENTPGTTDLQLQRLEAGAWRTLAEAVERNRSDDVRSFALDVSTSGEPFISWTELTDGASRLFVSRYDQLMGDISPLGAAINVGLVSDVEGLTFAAGDGGAPVVAFQEHVSGAAASYVARWSGTAFEVLGSSLDGRDAPALALGRNAEPLAAVARSSTGAIELQHYNESPRPPFGLSQCKPQPCTLPKDSDPAFPKRLSETGCYKDLKTQTIAEGWVPYELNSPLWSDGAHKRRFFSIPDNTNIGFTEVDAWELPVGTVLNKEFWLQRDPSDPRSLFIVETRLMIKRCEPGSCRASWQGYSYQWNETGDEASLLVNNTDSVFVDWPVAGGTHTHSYPGRDECTRCHALSAGGALGLRTQQFNRNYRYTDNVDNQLRALFHAGLFGDTPPPADQNTLVRLPTPSDPTFDLNAQVRGYFDANCSHCHSPTSRWPVVDLRFDAQLKGDDGTGTTGNICNMLVPGNAEASYLYVKLKARPGAVPAGFRGDTMPPIGRLLPDEAQLPRIKTWIDRMVTCP